MTGYETPPTREALPSGPPWPLDLLADLHAGVLEPDVAAELRARIADDPQARATLAALDATVAELHDLPPLQVPHDVAARIDAALHAETGARPVDPVGAAPAPTAPPPTAAPRAAAPAPTPHPQPVATPPGATDAASPAPDAVVDLAAARERRRRRGVLAGAGLLTAAAAAVAVIAVANLTGGQTAGTPRAGAPGAPSASDQDLPPLALTNSTLATALDDALAKADYGPLGATARLDACLQANAINPATSQPLGAREVTLDNKPGVLLILPTGTPARFHLVVVPPDCGPSNPGFLANAIVGR